MRPFADRAPASVGHGISRNASGMTLIEVVVILLVLGVLALAATTRITTGEANLRAAADGVSSHLRLVQTMAMNSSPGVRGLRFESSDNTYYMFRCTNPDDCNMDLGGNIIPLPGADTDENDRVAVSDGDIGLVADGNIAYNEFGIPFQIIGSTAVAADEPIIISFNDGAGNTHDIQITPKTGFIP